MPLPEVLTSLSNHLDELGSLYLLLQREKRSQRSSRRQKRWGVRPIFTRRKQLGEFHRLVQELKAEDPEYFFKYFRMDKNRFDLLVHKIAHRFSARSNAISAEEKLAVTLRYLSTGDSQQTIALSYRMGKSTVCSILDDVLVAIFEELSPEYLRAPTTAEEWDLISQGFGEKWHFPNCVGSIDGKHVVMQAPKLQGSKFFNHKGTHSIVLLAVVDGDYLFRVVDVGAEGRASDGGIFSKSEFGSKLESKELNLPEPKSLPNGSVVPYVFVGDAAFPLKENLIRPFPGKNLDTKYLIANYRISRARRIVENAFGVLASRFRIFRRPIIADPDKVDKIVLASCVLHNYLMINNPNYCPPTYVDQEGNDGALVEGEWRKDDQACSLKELIATKHSNFSKKAAEVRELFADYFVSPVGSVPWQNRYVRRGFRELN